MRLPDHHPKKLIYISNQLSALNLMQELHAYNIGTGIAGRTDNPLAKGQPCISIPLEGWPPIRLGWIAQKSRSLTRQQDFWSF